MNNNNLLKMFDISKKFPGVKALSSVDFSVNKREIVSIVGQNGAGKSTLVNIIGGIYIPDSGNIFIEDKQVRISNPSIAKKLGIGMVHQESTLVPTMTVSANLFLYREYVKKNIFLDLRRMSRETENILSILGYKMNPNMFVEDLSLVERRIVEIAKAMFFNPKILILDEVTASFGSKEVERLFELIKELKSKGMSIIFISHRLQEVIQISDRIIILRDGKRVGSYEKEGEVSIKNVIDLMIGKRIEKKVGMRKESKIKKEKKLLEVRNFSKIGYFKDINFDLYSGEILGFAGLKGAGITEIFKTLYGTLLKDSGEIYMKNKKLIIKRPRDSIKNRIGMITNDREKEGLALIRSVEENINISSLDDFTNTFDFFKTSLLERNAEKLISKIDIRTPSIKQEVLYLSGGNRQKVLLAKFLLCGLEVLIIDEPTKGIDVKTKVAVHNLLNRLKQEGKGVLMTSPVIPELLNICDRILIIVSGKIIKEVKRHMNDFDEFKILQTMHV